jgi:acetyl-CoA C-acetyltransferase
MTAPTANREAAGPRVVITHALRTPIGRYLGSFSELSGADLGTSVVRSLLERAGLDPAAVDEVFMGYGRQAGAGPNPARQIAQRSCIPVTTCATTVNMACGSGLKAIELGADAIRLGRADVVVAGGTETMSGLPYFLPKMRTGYRLGHAKVVDAMYQDGFHCPLADMPMGATAENLARQMEIPRSEQDAYALRSQTLAAEAWEAGRFDSEVAPVEVHGRRGEVTVVERDEHPRPGSTLEGLAKLPPVFDREAGTVTAGNSSGITDGAAALLLMTEERAAQLGLEVLAVVGPSAQSGVDPRIMGVGPVPAVRELCARHGRQVSDWELFELNEAFAAQVIACVRELELPMDRLNVNGGAIALGHPIGATGARIVVTLLHEMQRRGLSRGLATLCISGGMGMASEFTR